MDTIIRELLKNHDVADIISCIGIQVFNQAVTPLG